MLDATELKLLTQALAFAAHKHRDQRRKDPDASPYINHPITLMDILVNEGQVQDAKILCAALLHDTVEDTETTQEELQQAFGQTIAGIVMEVTDDKNLEKLERKRMQVEHAPHLSPAAQLVKLADKIANLRDITVSPPEEWNLERKQAYFDWALDVVDAMPDAWPELKKLFYSEYGKRP